MAIVFHDGNDTVVKVQRERQHSGKCGKVGTDQWHVERWRFVTKFYMYTPLRGLYYDKSNDVKYGDCAQSVELGEKSGRLEGYER